MTDFDDQVERLLSNIKKIPQKEQKSDSWYEEKTKIISATEISTIVNCNPFQTAAKLYNEKCHPERVTRISTPATEFGQTHEPIAKKHMLQKDQLRVLMIDLGLAKHPIIQYLGASPDGLLVIKDGENLRLWLVEIKCLYQREMSEQTPYNYWLQMQTQLYVWVALFKEIGYELEGCIYCENQFDMTDISSIEKVLLKSCEREILFDKNYYEENIIPVINQFWQLINAPKNKRKSEQSEHPNSSSKKSKKNVLSLDDIYSDYLTNEYVVMQKDYRNFINNDPLLDWLNLYGDRQQLPIDPSTKYDIKSFVGNQQRLLKQRICQSLEESLGSENYIDIGSTLRDSRYSKKTNSNGLSYGDLKSTVDAMNKGISVIIDAVLYNPNSRQLGSFDILVKYDQLKSVFPIAYKKLVDSDTDTDSYTNNTYTFIQIKYSKLKLCVKNVYLLNYNNQKCYKIEQAHLHQVLNYYQKPHKVVTSFIMGRKSTYASKGTTYDNMNVFNSVALIDLSSRDCELVEDLATACEWFSDLRKDGQLWSIDPPQKPQLFPNMKNTQDYPWNTYKNQLAEKNRDLTQLWYVGPAERDRLWETQKNKKQVTRWDQLNTGDLKMNEHYKNIVNSIISSNKTNMPVNFDKLRENLINIRTPIEFYLDFEFTNDLDDNFSEFPISNSSKHIYMIGCIYVNHEKSEVKYLNYLINRLDRNEEIAMIKDWLEDINLLNHDQPEITMYHWGSAEKQQLGKYLLSQNLLDTDNNDNDDNDDDTEDSNDNSNENEHNKIVRKFKMTDLCELFKNFTVGIPGCFGYGLKEIGKVFSQNGWINTIWSDQLSGEDAMIVAILAERMCQEGKIEFLRNHPSMSNFINYNYIDCKVPHEIVEYLRGNGS